VWCLYLDQVQAAGSIEALPKPPCHHHDMTATVASAVKCIKTGIASSVTPTLERIKQLATGLVSGLQVRLHPIFIECCGDTEHKRGVSAVSARGKVAQLMTMIQARPEIGHLLLIAGITVQCLLYADGLFCKEQRRCCRG
jgi:hypothetical protein